MYVYKRVSMFGKKLLLATLLLFIMGSVYVVQANDLNDETSYDVSPGVYHKGENLITDDGKQAIQMLEVDLGNDNLEVLPYAPNEQIYGPGTVGEMIDELRNNGKNVVAGINGDFFSSVGVPSGIQITNGEIFTSPRNTKAAMLIFPDRSVRLDSGIQMTATIKTEDGEALELNMVNRSRVATHANHAFLFNYRFGESAQTPEDGIEMVVNVGEGNDQLIAGQAITGQVETIEETSDSMIERGTFIISAIGEKADWITEKINKGDQIEILVTYNKDANEAEHILSGNSTLGTMLLRDGELAEELDGFTDAQKTDKHPRSMIAVKDGKLYMFAVDGRQAGFADGMTLSGAATYLQSLGMESAINIDGGGSTTYYARQPGEAEPKLINSLYDIQERPVGNSLLVVSKTQGSGNLSGINVFPSEATHKVVAGSNFRLTAKGYDDAFNRVEMDAKDFNWLTKNEIGTIDSTGLFTAGNDSGIGHIVVSNGDIEAEQEIIVTNDIARLEISPHNFIIETGKSEQMQVKAYDGNGDQLIISAHLLDWQLEGDIGEVTENGILKTTNSGSGIIAVSYEGVKTEANVTVGASPMIETFEDDANIRAHEVRTVPGSVQLSLVQDPVRFGTFAGELTYDFFGTEGTSASYIEFLDDNGELGQQIAGEPTQFGLWLYGDSKYHRLRLGITDGNGANALWNLTPPYGINWTGWKYVYATVPEDTVFPITIRNIAMEEANKHNKTAGVLYYDNFHAIYTDADHKADIGLIVENYIHNTDIQGALQQHVTKLLADAKNAFENGSRTDAENLIHELVALLDASTEDSITADAKTHLKDEIDNLLSSDSGMWNFTVSIEANEPPVIHAKDISIIAGGMFNALENVTASDAEDGDLTKQIDYQGEVDTETVGTYEVTYTVTDSDGATATKTITVTVEAKTETDPPVTELNEAPIIKAEDVTITVGDDFEATDYATATDAEDGNLTDDIEVIVNNVDPSTVGTYEVTYEVTDSGGATTTKMITVTVEEKVEQEKPTAPTDPDKSEDNDDGAENNSTDDGKELPKTATNIYTWLYVGMLLIAAAGIIAIYRRKPVK